MRDSGQLRRVAVIGSGYVGLVTGACLASKGHTVICVDTDMRKVDQINAGVPPIFEPGLETLMRDLPKGQLTAGNDVAAAVAASEVTFVSVGTPFDGSRIDLSQVELASRQIGRALRSKTAYHVVVMKSTVVPGTTDDLVTPILEEESHKTAGVDFGVVMNPEFLRQGEALEDFLFPDRIVIGTADERAAALIAGTYGRLDPCPILTTSAKTAELIKYASNALLATLISFSNEIGNLCASLDGVDVVDVMKGVHLDRRLTPTTVSGERITPGMLRYLEAGCGFGGSCFPKDVKALVAHGANVGSSMDVLQAVLTVNRQQPLRMVALLRRHFPDLVGVRVAVLGLAFKPGTDDMREAPAIPVIRELLSAGAVIIAHDPVAAPTAARIFGSDIAFSESLAECVRDAQAVVVMTPWPEFNQLPSLLASRHPQPVVVDGRRVLSGDSFDRYEAIGLGRSEPSVAGVTAG